MAENKKPKEHLSWWYFLAKYVMLFFFKILHPYRIIGRENMPLTGKLLVCSNHVTMGDPIYLGCAIPKRQYTIWQRPSFLKTSSSADF